MRYLLSRILPLLLLPLGLIVVPAVTIQGQEYSYARYDVKDGLAGSVVYCATEDKDGFLWFGTETGLSRFDGTHFKNFTTADGLPDNEVLRLFVDSKGRMWIGTYSNAICYYYKGKIHTQQNDSLLSLIAISSAILDVVEDRDGCLLVLETKAVHIITPDSTITTIDKISNSGFFASKAGLGPDGNFKILIGISVDGKPLLTIAHNKVRSIRRMSMNVDSGHNDAWFYPGIEMIKNINERLHFTQYPDSIKSSYMSPAGYNSVSLINDSICTINTTDGSLFYNIRKGSVFRHCLKNKIINAVFRDSEDNYWFASQGAGIFRVGSFDFNNISFTENNIDYYSIFSIAKIGASVYAGAEKSLLYKIDTGKAGLIITKIHLSDNIGHNRVLSIVPISGNKVILGTTFGLLELKDAEHKMTRDSAYALKSLSLYHDRFLVSTHLGTFLIDKSLSLIPGHIDSIYQERSICAYGRNDTFYVGTLAGLYRVIGAKSPPVFLGTQYPALKGRITDIREGPDGILWIATNGNGLVGYQHNKVVYHIRQQDGLTSNICRSLFLTSAAVWVGTDKGLNKIQFKQGSYTITTFTSTDGLIADIINVVSVQDNEVYVGTPAGLTYFDANKITLHSYCKLRITDIHTPHGNWAYDTSGFVLAHADNDIRIEYAGISYRSAGDIVYRYRLKGLNDNWQTTKETFISYPSLPSGDYELQLTAINKFGVKSEMVLLPFSVQKLLWEKNWFRILGFMLIAGAIWFFVNLRIKKIRRQNDEKTQVNERIAELEQMALKAQMNPHFIFNSLNSVQHYVIEKDILGANKFITEFSRLIRMTLDISTKTKISLYEEISYLTTYLELEKTKFENKFSYQINLAEDLDPSEWYIPPMILQPYVENSIRHGVRNRTDNNGHIKVVVYKDLVYLVCSIEDNGVGRETAARYKSQLSIEYQSKGMTLTARRIEMLNKGQHTPVLIHIEDLYQDSVGAGTRVIVKFPLTDAGRDINAII